MKVRFMVMVALALSSAATGARGETIAGLPLHVQRFDAGAVRVWLGDHVSSTATVAIPTAKGILVIDTTGDPRVDLELRRVIARELGRSDFAMLINTHEHEDHTGGNEVYADCEIVGHERVAVAMNAPADRQRQISWNARRISELEQQIAGLPADAPERARLQEELAIATLRRECLAQEHRRVPPRTTFTDRLTLELGDTTVELFYIGGMHANGDIAVLVPKHGLLLTGDTMADTWLTDSPGCLAAFGAHAGVHHDFPLLLKNWNLLLGRQAGIATLVTGHWNGELSWAGCAARVRYIEELWAGVQRLAAAGATLDAVQAEYALDSRFPELVGARGCDARINAGTIREMWGVVTNQWEASDALSALTGDEPAFMAVVARVRAKSPDYYTTEGRLNGLAYWLVEIEKLPLALEVFRLNVDLYPESWNVHDSLAEGLLKTGDRAGAIASYERSLQLNPGNENGKHMLEQIRAGVAVPTPIQQGQS